MVSNNIQPTEKSPAELKRESDMRKAILTGNARLPDDAIAAIIDAIKSFDPKPLKR